MALDLCERLRATGLQPIAPVLIENGVRSVTDILPNTAPLLEAGLQAWQLEAVILGCIEVLPSLPKERADHPKVRPRKRASWAAALEAAQPGKRQAALDALQAAVLAFTTKASTDSRVQSEDVRWSIRDTVRAIKRGLGPAQLKDSFDLELLQPIVPYTRQCTEFHVGQAARRRDRHGTHRSMVDAT